MDEEKKADDATTATASQVRSRGRLQDMHNQKMTDIMNDIVTIAKVCHDANRSFCEAIGDHSQPPWESAPQWQKDSAFSGVQMHLRHLARGIDIQPSTSHENWVLDKLQDGWKYGPVKDTTKKEHPCIVPFDQLPPHQQMKDYLFAAIVKAFWKANSDYKERRGWQEVPR